MDGNYLCAGKSAYRPVLPVPGSENPAGRCKVMKKKEQSRDKGKQVTIRVQKTRKSHIKQKLIIFSVLAVCLVILAIFSDRLCPYDPMPRISPAHFRHLVCSIPWERILMVEICYPG